LTTDFLLLLVFANFTAIGIAARAPILLTRFRINTGTTFLEFPVFDQENFYRETGESQPDEYG
jgi:hypothetical protein